MKYIAILSLAVVTLALGACSGRNDASTSQQTHSSASTGYSK
ncbi:MAG TPA: hypothetical protein VF593_09875 [Chthoniobacteraceae bacterium]|jgi:hypothetical protein